ncbi:unnamed protein product [Oppiella nova]|uniref:Zinc transporter 2 n=1 Tax=Oppiella nova TaxID=334625 RepID=A0A7R9MKQ5_9ACAR|nr:unnamed protein product [Oppiella nova]CAG2179177.1 unnamed protein product [Oppiella nova]
MIWILTAVLVYLAVERIRDADYEIDSNAMLIVSGVGVVMNVVMGLTLSDTLCCKRVTDDSHGSEDHPHSHNSHSHSHASHGHSHTNMNVRAALIHVIGDLIQSIGVLIAALIIHFKPDYKISDPICTFIFSALVMFTTYGIMKEAVYVLMEGFPTYLDYSTVKKDLMDIEGVQTVHSLHIWSLTLNRNALSVHLATNGTSDAERVLKAAEALIRKKYDIQETTIQVERYDARAMDECLVCVGP